MELRDGMNEPGKTVPQIIVCQFHVTPTTEGKKPPTLMGPSVQCCAGGDKKGMEVWVSQDVMMMGGGWKHR